MIMSMITMWGRYSKKTSVAVADALSALNSIPIRAAIRPTTFVIPTSSSMIRSLLGALSFIGGTALMEFG